MRLTHEGELHGRVDEEHLLLLRHLRSSPTIRRGRWGCRARRTRRIRGRTPSLFSRARTLEASEYRIRDCTAIRGQLTPQLNQRGGAARANKDREGGGGEQGRTGTAGGRGRAAAAPGHGECRPAFPLRRQRTGRRVRRNMMNWRLSVQRLLTSVRNTDKTLLC